ncbi:uncharacterized protein LOC114268122 [Camellia sinensis]|uniref:uncharacterized protein LOC114268122 n=1 Tax=Camellia sinensis TaxID=4442 RepID=UPI001036C8E9|nr:uncharacterized protein LOC114268122 [Camellia sinensis]
MSSLLIKCSGFYNNLQMKGEKDFKNFYPNNKKEAPKGDEQKSESKAPEKVPGEFMEMSLGKHCAYHNEDGHLTQGCKALKTHFEDLVRQGYLRDLVDEARIREEHARLPQAPAAPPLPSPPQQADGPRLINVIHLKLNGNEVHRETQRVRHLHHVYQVQQKKTRTDEHQGLMVSFTEADLDMVQHPHNNALVITLKIGDCQVRCYKELGLHPDDLEQFNSLMVGFNGTPTWPVGATNLEVQAGMKKVSIEFTVIDIPSPYNVILGRHTMRAVPLTLHQLLQFLTEHGIEKVRGDQIQAKNYSMAAMKSTCNVRETEIVEIKDEDMEVLDDVNKELADKSEEALKKILVKEDDIECFFFLSSSLAEEEERELKALL